MQHVNLKTLGHARPVVPAPKPVKPEAKPGRKGRWRDFVVPARTPKTPPRKAQMDSQHARYAAMLEALRHAPLSLEDEMRLACAVNDAPEATLPPEVARQVEHALEAALLG